MPSRNDDQRRDARFLIVDDEATNVRLLRLILERAGYHRIRTTTDPTRARALVERFRPDLVLLDLHMPDCDGYQVLDRLRPMADREGYLPVLALTADDSRETCRRALARGAHDLVIKPFDHTEILHRIANLLRTRRLYLGLQEQNRSLDRMVRERTRELEDARYEVLERLARAAEYRDDVTGEHTRRVGELSAALAGELGLPADEAETIGRAALLHDVGKIGVPDAVLLKRGRLTPAEAEINRNHTVIGRAILSGGLSRLTNLAAVIAHSHHERWDGLGYPQGLEGEAIPLAAQIVAVADVYDALRHERPYKEAWPAEHALALIRSERGKHFSPRVVDALLRVMARRDLLPAESGVAAGEPGCAGARGGARADGRGRLDRRFAVHGGRPRPSRASRRPPPRYTAPVPSAAGAPVAASNRSNQFRKSSAAASE